MEFITANEAERVVATAIREKREKELNEALNSVYGKIYEAMGKLKKYCSLGYILENDDARMFLGKKGFEILEYGNETIIIFSRAKSPKTNR